MNGSWVSWLTISAACSSDQRRQLLMGMTCAFSDCTAFRAEVCATASLLECPLTFPPSRPTGICIVPPKYFWTSPEDILWVPTNSALKHTKHVCFFLMSYAGFTEQSDVKESDVSKGATSQYQCHCVLLFLIIGVIDKIVLCPAFKPVIRLTVAVCLGSPCREGIPQGWWVSLSSPVRSTRHVILLCALNSLWSFSWKNSFCF